MVFDKDLFQLIQYEKYHSGWVDENGPVGVHVAYINAEDMDSNGIKTIELLENENFELDKGLFQVFNSRFNKVYIFNCIPTFSADIFRHFSKSLHDSLHYILN